MLPLFRLCLTGLGKHLNRVLQLNYQESFMVINRSKELPFVDDPHVLKTIEQRLVHLWQVIENGISRAFVTIIEPCYGWRLFENNF